ncbi:GspMb/PilO family protein [Terriglobus aquaticus]|uniref:GspMb/PilO family protein n=1 Tax=Terriglobus aquaticus TaxID=940139 RepID=A0ABW9KJ65_9BACT|nr:GspMb/PilO family protein [Terriglobus aquaticus]
MSTIPVNPAQTASPPTARAQRLDQLRAWMSPLNVHIAAAALLLLFNLWLAVQLVLAFSAAGARGEDQIAQARAQQLAADLAARKLRGLDGKLATSEAEVKDFYSNRLPYGYADVAAELGKLRDRTGVRLSRVQYQTAAPSNGLTPARLDASVTGEYRQLALFINGLERDRSFFQIENITLNGQQGGQVSLRLRISTYLREPMPGLATAEANSSSGNGGTQ